MPPSVRIPWIPNLQLEFVFRLDALAAVLCILILGVGALVLFYCARYFKSDDPDVGAFGARLLAFAAAMFGLVTADDVAIAMVLVGAITKSALVPFHFWLPGAMAAPVSAYLQAAAMVKAGVLLVARFAPGFSETAFWHPVILILGMATMMLGGWRALRQFDLKLVLAYGTVSQLGFLTMVVGLGGRDGAVAGLGLVLAHGFFKATLFLVVGIIDHQSGTRDLRVLSGVGGTSPVLFAVALVAAGSMGGVPPLLGFVAKESVYEAFVHRAEDGVVGMLLLGGIVLGSVLTFVYSARFVWGAFALKHGKPRTAFTRIRASFLLAPAVLAVDAGVALYLLRPPFERLQGRIPAMREAEVVYRSIIGVFDDVAVWITGRTQRSSLAFYLFVILSTAVVTPRSD